VPDGYRCMRNALTLGGCACVTAALLSAGCSTSVRMTAGPTYASVGERQGFGGQVLLTGAVGLSGGSDVRTDFSMVAEVGASAHHAGAGLPLGGGIDVARRSREVVGRMGFRSTYTVAQDPTISLLGVIALGAPLPDTDFTAGVEARGGIVAPLGDPPRSRGAEAMLGVTLEWYHSPSRSGRWWGDF
jgi:hypothetical protein